MEYTKHIEHKSISIQIDILIRGIGLHYLDGLMVNLLVNIMINRMVNMNCNHQHWQINQPYQELSHLPSHLLLFLTIYIYQQSIIFE